METENKVKNKNVQTYAEDMAKVIESDGGAIKKIIHEEEEREIEKKNLSPESRKNKVFMLVSLVLVVLSFSALIFIAVFKQQIFTVNIAPQFASLIFTDQSKFLEVSGLNKDKIAQTVSNEVNATKVKVGGIEGIYLTENNQVVRLRQFIALIKSSFVPGQAAFIDDNFLTGVFNTGVKSASPAGGNFFILLKVRSFADVFSTIKSWENKMFYDLHGFFGRDISVDTNYLLTKDFTDGLVANKSARILYDKDGKIVLMYVFADDNSVIITNTQEAAQEIINRLSAGQISK